jgi:hypothetical protein
LSAWERRAEWSTRADVIVNHGRIGLTRKKKSPPEEVKERVRGNGNCHEVERDGKRIHEGCGFVLEGALLPSILVDNCSGGKEVKKEWK